MVEQKVGLELIAIDRKDLLTTYKRKTVAKFQEELNDILLECELEVLLLIVLIESEELQVIRVL